MDLKNGQNLSPQQRVGNGIPDPGILEENEK